MYVLRNSVILRGMFCMCFNCKKRKKKKIKENRRKGIKITSKQIGRGTNCSSSSLFSLEMLYSKQLFSEVELSSKQS